MLSKAFSFYICCGHFEEGTKAILTFSVVGHPRNISEKLYIDIEQLAYEELSFKNFFFISSSGGHFVQWSSTILAFLVKGHQRNISVKLS